MNNRGFVRPILIIIGFLAVLFVLVIVVISVRNSGLVNNLVPHQETTPTPAPIAEQQPFTVISTDPVDQAVNIDTGEIEILINTDRDILNTEKISLEFNPKLPFYSKFTNTFPTKQLVIKIYGGLQPKTQYQVSLNDQVNQKVYSWSFLTKTAPAESSSALVKDEEQQLNDQYFPLYDVTPYYSADFDVGYNDKLNLNVRINNPDVTRVKQEVNDWIRSNGVDPNTHTINYINNF